MCKIVDSLLCDFCKSDIESITHLFWECPIVSKVWKEFGELLKEKCPHSDHLKLSEQLILFGEEENITTDRVFDYMITVVKFFIYKCRFTKTVPTMEAIRSYLRIQYFDEKHISLSNFQYDFALKWMPYTPMFLHENENG